VRVRVRRGVRRWVRLGGRLDLADADLLAGREGRCAFTGCFGFAPAFLPLGGDVFRETVRFAELLWAADVVRAAVVFFTGFCFAAEVFAEPAAFTGFFGAAVALTAFFGAEVFAEPVAFTGFFGARAARVLSFCAEPAAAVLRVRAAFGAAAPRFAAPNNSSAGGS
jgi:hypothetical protein